MSGDYTRDVLKVVVAKICQTIGWHSIHTTPLEVMVDILRRYLSEITKLTASYSTLFGHTQPNLDELGLAFRDLHINIADLEEYVHYVDSSPPVEIPQYPVRKESHLNFLKPGSNEVVTRPVHIHEHLPPMLPEIEEGEQNSAVPKLEEAQQPNVDTSTSVFKRPADMPPNDSNAKRPRSVKTALRKLRRRIRKYRSRIQQTHKRRILRQYTRQILKQNIKLCNKLILIVRSEINSIRPDSD